VHAPVYAPLEFDHLEFELVLLMFAGQDFSIVGSLHYQLAGGVQDDGFRPAIVLPDSLAEVFHNWDKEGLGLARARQRAPDDAGALHHRLAASILDLHHFRYVFTIQSANGVFRNILVGPLRFYFTSVSF